MSDHPLLLDIFSLGPLQLRTGLGFLFSFKVSFEKHPNAHAFFKVRLGLKMTPPPPLELFQKFIRFGSGTLPLIADVEVGVGESLVQLSAWQQLDKDTSQFNHGVKLFIESLELFLTKCCGMIYCISPRVC